MPGCVYSAVPVCNWNTARVFTHSRSCNLASALPLGYISSGEVLDGWIRDNFTTIDLAKSIQAALPPGLELITIEGDPIGSSKGPGSSQDSGLSGSPYQC